jgi:hypothetical protein
MVIIPVIIAALTIIIAPISGEMGIDSSLFYQEGCKAPCWNDLTPGQSTSEDIDDFLANLSENQWPERDTYVSGTGCKSTQVVDKFGIGILHLDVVDGNLTFIRSSPLNKTRLGKIVDSFGDPEYFEALLYIGFDYSVYTLEVYYPQKGLAFEISTDQEKDLGMSEGDILKNLPGQEKIGGKVEANMVVGTIHYFEPGDLLSYYQSRYPCPVDETDTLRSVQSSIENFIQE